MVGNANRVLRKTSDINTIWGNSDIANDPNVHCVISKEMESLVLSEMFL